VLTEEGTSRYVQAGRLRLHYHEAGEGGPLICIHGGGPGASGWSNFRRNFPELSRHFRTVLLDLPGYGRSNKVPVEGPPFRFYAAAVREFMDALGIERAHYWGYSMGGHTGFHFLKRYPERVLGFVNGASGAGFPRRDLAAVRARAEAMASGDLKAIAATWNASEQAMRVLLEGNDLKALAACILGNLDSERVDPTGMSVPSLHYVGERDPILPGTRAAAERMVGASFHVIPGEDHLSCFRHSQRVLPLVFSFLEEQARAA
jgi:pimeloyl-ACP methyl ester carboxylesterase